MKPDTAPPAAGGMLDRSRMALCTFTFLFLSLNPLASLFYGGMATRGTPGSAVHAAASSRAILGHLEGMEDPAVMDGWMDRINR